MFTPLVFLIRNLFIAFEIVFLYNTDQAKIILFVILNIGFLAWILILRPYIDIIMNLIVIINELFITFVSFYMFGFVKIFDESVAFNKAFMVIVYIFFVVQLILLLMYTVLKVIKMCTDKK